MVRILGVDTALRQTGFGLVDFDKNKPAIIDCGFIKNQQKLTISDCLRRLSGGIEELIKTYAPDQVVIEGTFFQKNARTSMILGMARGAVVATAARYNLPIYEYSPKEAKKAVTGNGSSSKEQVAFMISRLVGISLTDMPLDATDALALTFCHNQYAALPAALQPKLL